MAKGEYLIRWRNDDGSWEIETEVIYSKREAEKERQRVRVLCGIQSQLWHRDEWLKNHPEEH